VTAYTRCWSTETKIFLGGWSGERNKVCSHPSDVCRGDRAPRDVDHFVSKIDREINHSGARPPMSTAPGGGSVGVGANCCRWWAISSVLTVLVLVVSASAQCVFNCASDPPQVRAHAVCVCVLCVHVHNECVASPSLPRWWLCEQMCARLSVEGMHAIRIRCVHSGRAVCDRCVWLLITCLRLAV
jgi:hypothetical protein